MKTDIGREIRQTLQRYYKSMRWILRDATYKQTKDRHNHSKHNDRPRQTGGETWAEAQRDFQQTELTDRSGALIGGEN